MKLILLAWLLMAVAGSAAWAADGATTRPASSQPDARATTGPDVPVALSFTMKTLAGEDVSLTRYRGKVVLIVNVASKCGFTPQYKGLEALHEKYGGQGLAILGMPCNQFKGQEPGTAEEIQQFCQSKYDVKFDLFAKLDVNGDKAAPLYRYLTGPEVPIADDLKGPVKWNFEKFLIDRKGQVIARYRSAIKTEQIAKDIEAALAQ